MRDLEGSLDVFPPIAILQLMNLAVANGELRLKVKGNSARVFFEKGCVTFAGITNRPVKLGELLVQAELISEADLEKALKSRSKKRLGDRLVKQGLIDREQLQLAVEEQIKEVIYEIIRWQDGRFTFTRDRRPSEQDIFIDIPLDHLVLEGIKRMDEERKSVG